jgi:hypothetical protein
MPNRVLNAEELVLANELLAEIRGRLQALSRDDPELLFAFRRKLFKELSYDERSAPSARRKLKALKRTEQSGVCPLCQKALPASYVVLDRIRAVDGYTAQNTRLICQECDIAVQRSRGYA